MRHHDQARDAAGVLAAVSSPDPDSRLFRRFIGPGPVLYF